MEEQNASDGKVVALTVDAGVAIVTLNRPRRHNAIDLPMRAALADALRSIAQDRSVRAVVLTGAGGSFCAGGDIGSMRDRAPDIEDARRRMRDAGEVALMLSTLDCPVIAAVDGPAYGAGFGLALACDFILGTQRARFCASFIRIGLMPDCLLHASLPRWVGPARARELIFSGREVRAPEAQALGILYRLCPAETLLDDAVALARRFLDASPTALAQSKALLNQVHAMDLRQVAEAETAGQAMCLETASHRAAADRFMTGAPPLFSWEEENPADRTSTKD
ncbi:MAG: enoyl-CoA hydratase/isomerase family protein [Pararhodobacter sp.]